MTAPARSSDSTTRTSSPAAGGAREAEDAHRHAPLGSRVNGGRLEGPRNARAVGRRRRARVRVDGLDAALLAACARARGQMCVGVGGRA